MLRLISNVLIVLSATVLSLRAEPDIRSVPADLVTPPLLEDEPPAPGRRVKQQHPSFKTTEVYHVLHLPNDWAPERKDHPVIVEFAGNGPYQSAEGDISTGLVEGSKLGYGLSGGNAFIWLCLPYLNDSGTDNLRKWWGDPPSHNPQQTIDYALQAVPWVCEQFGGDPNRVVLCGFSRGAIACNYIGLHNDAIAKLWCSFIAYSHYDGVREDWGYPLADRAAARLRLDRLQGRPQAILHETKEGSTNVLEATRTYLKSTGIALEGFTFMKTGFRNHNDAWILRPSPAREQLRAWLTRVIRRSAANPSKD